MKGKVKFFNEGKGFGFITGDDGKDVFVHTSGIQEGVVLRDNDSVEFDVEQGDKGAKAVNVKKVEETAEEQPTEEATEETVEETPAEEATEEKEETVEE